MKAIEQVVIVGMGALGLLFGQMIEEHVGGDHLCFVMDEERKRRHSRDVYTINGKEKQLRILSPAEISWDADLVVIATKYSGLYEARDMIRTFVGADTTIVSLLNGISSESILAEVYPREQIIDTVAIGMDAVRDGTDLTYENSGRWQIGIRDSSQTERLRALEDFLIRAHIPYEVCSDIKRAMWNKFMINVGINQTCMVYETNYGGATRGGEAGEDMARAMHEVMAVAGAEGISLTEEDYEKDMQLLKSLNPEGFPSMRQDALAGRRSEVELFAGTMLRLARKHGIDVPVNEKYYRRILEMERNAQGEDRLVREADPKKCESSGGDIRERYAFRELAVEEIEQAIKIEQSCFPPHEACTPEMMRRRADAAPEIFLVAVDRASGRLAGFLNGIATDEQTFRDAFFTDPSLHRQEGSCIMLCGLAVLPQHRRQGLARELVRAYCRRERERGRKRLVLTCLESKVEMYRKFGFADNGAANSAWGGEEWHEMVIALHS